MKTYTFAANGNTTVVKTDGDEEHARHLAMVSSVGVHQPECMRRFIADKD